MTTRERYCSECQIHHTRVRSTLRGDFHAQRYPGIAGSERRCLPFSRRLASIGGLSACSALDLGWRGARGNRFRSLEYTEQHPAAVPAAVGSRLRCHQLAVALLPARRRNRYTGLAVIAHVRDAARALKHDLNDGQQCFSGRTRSVWPEFMLKREMDRDPI